MLASSLLAALGAALVAFTILDALWTTVSAQGGGPLSRRFGRGLWRLIRWGAPARSARRQAAGAIVLIGTLWLWVALLWAGWTLVFASVEGAVVDATNRSPADFPARVYFTGFTLFTLGNGDYVPSGSTWRVLTSVASFTGLFLVTLAITYVLPVVQAVVSKRQLAASIHALGSSGVEITRSGAESGPSVARQLERIASDLTLHGQRHLVYPILHYFQSGERRTAIAPNVAALSDALLLFRTAPDLRVDTAATTSATAALNGYLDVLDGHLLAPAEDAPPLPDPTPLDTAGITVDPARLERASDARVRQRLVSLLHQNGWDWPTPHDDA